MAFDLSTLLKPIPVRSSFLGTVEVDARKQSFYDWFRQGRTQERWANPHAFVRSLLAEQACLKSTGEPPGVARIDALTPRQLNAIAKAFIKASGKQIVPRLIEDRGGKRLRARRDGEDYPLARQSGENESARLLRLLSDRDDESRARARQHAADLRKMLEGPAGMLRLVDPIGDQINKLRREMLGPSVLAEFTASGRATTLRAQLEAQTRSSAAQISRAIDTAILGRNLHTSAVRQYDYLASELAIRESEISRARSTLASVVGASSTADRFLQAEMAQRRAWGESVRQFLHPSLASGLLASVVGVQRNIAVSDAIEAAAGLSRGFMTAANLGLTGAAARGAAAAVLSQYRADPSYHSDLFRDVMRGIQLVDADELDDDRLAEGLSHAQRNTRRIDLTDPAQAALLLALISILLSVYQTVLQYEAMDAAKFSATSADVHSVQIEMKALRDDLRRDREERRREWRDVRYVIDATPLRAEPDGSSIALLTVYPDQLLRILEVKGRWARVEVISYSSGATESGWISRRRLRVRAD
jgi:hypothetical protein